MAARAASKALEERQANARALLAALSLSGRSFRFVFQEPEQAASAWFTCSMSRPNCVTSMCKKAGRKYNQRSHVTG